MGEFLPEESFKFNLFRALLVAASCISFLSEEGEEKIRAPEVGVQVFEMMKEYFGEPYPTHSFWVAKSLAHPDYLLELEVIAVKE